MKTIFYALVLFSMVCIAVSAQSSEDDLFKDNTSGTLQIDGDIYQVEWMAREIFDETWLDRWAVEGDSLVKIEKNKLFIGRRENKHLNTAAIWYRPDLPSDVIVRFRAKPLPPEENNACNLNLFLHAREMDGSELRFGRSGVYKEYHQIPNYIITFVGGRAPGWSRLRKNPGFNMLHESEIKSEVNREYLITVTSYKGRIRYYIDGSKRHDYQDKEPLAAGKFGIRAWSTTGYWHQVEFGKIISDYIK
ncbi:hypothetical protein JW926_07925 [Candidatus Sumerlaeota bacterium]|nr:hypothetical protein [Candidatus Sumerlaeota bacterium]